MGRFWLALQLPGYNSHVMIQGFGFLVYLRAGSAELSLQLAPAPTKTSRPNPKKPQTQTKPSTCRECLAEAQVWKVIICQLASCMVQSVELGSAALPHGSTALEADPNHAFTCTAVLV